jgi:hypothetical protein
MSDFEQSGLHTIEVASGTENPTQRLSIYVILQYLREVDDGMIQVASYRYFFY